MLHPSVSRTHAILIVDADSNVQLIDPGSKAGTTIDDNPLTLNVPYLLKNNQNVRFGESSRTYTVSLDYSKVSRTFELEKNKLESDLKILESLEGEDLDLETLQKSLGIKKKDTIWVGGLIPSVTEEDMRELFEDCGKIVSIRVPEDRQTRQAKGFAFITFKDDKGARNALARDGIPYYKKFLKVSIAENKSDLPPRERKRDEEVKYARRSRSRDKRRSNSRDNKYRSRRRDDRRDRRHHRNSPETYEEHKRKKYRGRRSRNSSSSSSSDSRSSKNSKGSSKSSDVAQ